MLSLPSFDIGIGEIVYNQGFDDIPLYITSAPGFETWNSSSSRGSYGQKDLFSAMSLET